MTACWSKGRSRMYGYYFRQTRGCENRRVNIRKESIEDDFETLLRQMRPTPGLFHIATKMLKEIWEDRQAGLPISGKGLKSELAKLETETTRVMERLVKASKDSIIAAYEAEIDRLHLRKTELVERSRSTRDDAPSFERAYRTALDFLGNSGLPTDLRIAGWSCGSLLPIIYPTAAKQVIEPRFRPYLSRS